MPQNIHLSCSDSSYETFVNTLTCAITITRSTQYSRRRQRTQYQCQIVSSPRTPDLASNDLQTWVRTSFRSSNHVLLERYRLSVRMCIGAEYGEFLKLLPCQNRVGLVKRRASRWHVKTATRKARSFPSSTRFLSFSNMDSKTKLSSRSRQLSRFFSPMCPCFAGAPVLLSLNPRTSTISWGHHAILEWTMMIALLVSLESSECW
jgi:hypothetical protein